MQHTTFSSRGLDLAASLWSPPQGEPSATVLLAHQASGNRGRWRPFGPGLAQAGYLAIAPDMAGHGDSEGPRHHVHVRNWARDLLDIADQAGQGPLALVGLGSGGSASLVAAAQDPRVEALVLLSPRARPWRMPLSTALFWQSLRAMGLLNRLVLRSDLRISLSGLFGPLELAHDPEINEELHADPEFREAVNAVPVPGSWDSWFFNGLGYARRLDLPTLILHGSHDQLNSPSNSEALRDALSAPSELVLLEHSGHLIPLDAERDEALLRIRTWLGERLSAD